MTRGEQIDFLLDHAQRRRHRRVLPGASFTRTGGNPGCGDVITIYGQVEGDCLALVTFQAEGCILSEAGGSIVAEMASGFTLSEAEQLGYDRLFDVIGRDLATARPRCATLSLDTLKQALRLYGLRKLLETRQRSSAPASRDPCDSVVSARPGGGVTGQ